MKSDISNLSLHGLLNYVIPQWAWQDLNEASKMKDDVSWQPHKQHNTAVTGVTVKFLRHTLVAMERLSHHRSLMPQLLRETHISTNIVWCTALMHKYQSLSGIFFNSTVILSIACFAWKPFHKTHFHFINVLKPHYVTLDKRSNIISLWTN